MKSYLELVPVSAKVHRKRNRMSVFCIMLSVFLVTVIFGMADMFIRSQIMQTRIENGSWHIMLQHISGQQGELISTRPDVKNASWYGVLNYRSDQGYTLSGKNLIIAGSDECWAADMLVDFIAEGAFPQNNNEALLSESAKSRLGIEIRDQITVDAPDGGKLSYTITGFTKNTAKTMSEDSYALLLSTSGFRSIFPAAADEANTTKTAGLEASGSAPGNKDKEPDDYNSVLYVQFRDRVNIRGAISQIREQYGLSQEQVSENTKLLGLTGQSGNDFMLQIYGSAAVLFLLVLLAGILMITSSLNSNVAERTEFFGMIRCIGATPRQVMRLVKREALGWCKMAVPVGVGSGMILIWGLCAMLRYLSPEYFGAMPAFSVSFPSMIAGAAAGVLTVLLAARSPAKRASGVSPLAAVTGNASVLRPVKKAVHTQGLRIDTVLGIHHAVGNRKNLVLMAGSFSLSIILFLGFTVTVRFMNQALTPLKPWTADISVISPDYACSIPVSLLQEYQKNPGVKRVFGRMFSYNVPVDVGGVMQKADLISYEENQFKWAEEYLLEGDVKTVLQEKRTGLVVYSSQNSIQTGDTVTFHFGERTGEIRIAGILSSSPFSGEAGVDTVICSEETFREITGLTDYTIVDVQLKRSASEQDVQQLYQAAGKEVIFADERLDHQGVRGAYYSFGLFIYGFLAVIILIAVFNIVNSIGMSVSARMREYGALRAIGLSHRQLGKMIVCEACSYAVTGGVCGTVFGLLLNKFLFEKLVTFQWGTQWSVPLGELGVIIGVMIISVFIAVRRPLKRVRTMSIVDTIGAL